MPQRLFSAMSRYVKMIIIRCRAHAADMPLLARHADADYFRAAMICALRAAHTARC